MYDRPVCWFDSDTAIRRHGRHLPHLTVPDGVHFVTLRLGDSIPGERLRAWSAERHAWLSQNPPPHTPEQLRYFHRCSLRLHKYLDAGHGACFLRDPELRRIIINTLCHDDGEAYSLGPYVIMPNHVHVLVQTPGEVDAIAATWASVSAHRLNKAIGRTGRLWQREPFDHVIRNERRLSDASAYIIANPAGLPPGTFTLGNGKAKW